MKKLVCDGCKATTPLDNHPFGPLGWGELTVDLPEPARAPPPPTKVKVRGTQQGAPHDVEMEFQPPENLGQVGFGVRVRYDLCPKCVAKRSQGLKPPKPKAEPKGSHRKTYQAMVDKHFQRGERPQLGAIVQAKDLK